VGFDLTSESGESYQMRSGGWSLVLSVADAYAWAKQGSLPPEGVAATDWDGSYASNDGQRVTAEDARALADAIERMLADEDRVARVREVAILLEEQVRQLAKREYGIDLPPETHGEYPVDEPSLRDLVRFCRQGGFRID
jgi:hypothetical protein